MRNLIVIVIALAMFIGAAPRVMAGQTQIGAEIDQAWALVMEQQKKQEAKWKALDKEATKLFEQQDKNEAHRIKNQDDLNRNGSTD